MDDRNMFGKRESNNNFASLPQFPATVFQILQTSKPTKEEQEEHAWNPSDRSPNIQIHKTDNRIITRQPVADSTDSVRGKKGYSSGIHIWEVVWPKDHRGSHAVIGLATKEAELHVKHYCALIGSNKHSWGWNIVSNQLLHNSGFKETRATTSNIAYSNHSLGPYPKTTHFDDNGDEYRVSENFLMILDMDEGTLAFSVDGVYLGVAFHGLKGQTLHPALSAVWGNAKIQLNYLGGIVQPPSLASICRLAITEITRVDSARIECLPLPNRLKEFLLYQL